VYTKETGNTPKIIPYLTYNRGSLENIGARSLSEATFV